MAKIILWQQISTQSLLLYHSAIQKKHIYSQLQGYVLHSQILSVSALSRVFFKISQDIPVSYVMEVFGTLYGVWNLDFFRMYYPGFCLQTGTLATLSLYPLILVAVTYVLVRL